MEAGGHRILAILDFKVPGLVGGDKGRARHTFDRALEIAPNNPVTVFYLADFYAATGEKQEALQTLDKLETLKPSGGIRTRVHHDERAGHSTSKEAVTAKILLTGATGYVGGRLLAALIARGEAVRCLSRRPEALASHVLPPNEIVPGDVFDKASLLRATAGIETA